MAADDASQRADLEAWQMLQAWLSQDKEGQVLLSQIKSGERIEIALKQWIKARQTRVPPRLTTYVSGGQLGKLVNIAQAQNVYIYPERPRLSRQEYRNRRELLNEVKQEVLGRLRQSLHNAVLINLQKESQPQQVRQPWDVEVKIGEQASYQLTPGTEIIEVFDREEISGRLLILGAPGSGKTTTQLELAQALITGAEKDDSQPIPVLFNLSSWKDDKQPIADWLVAELKSKYGIGVDIGRKLVEKRQLLPLLDGLDEVESERQERCVQAINQLLESEQRPPYLVVCSRLEEYESYDTELQLNGAICLQPLNEAQIHQYLVDVKRSELWQYIQNDPSLLDLARTPLLLSIMTLAHKEISLQEWQRLNTTQERLEYLFSAYTQRMLTRQIKSLWYIKGKEPKPEQTKRWLVWLAKQLKAESQTEFLIERMQLTWLQTLTQRWMYRIGVVSIVALIFVALMLGPADWLRETLPRGELVTKLVKMLGNWSQTGLGEIIVGLIAGLIVGLRQTIKPIETLKWSGARAWKGLALGLRRWSIAGLTYGTYIGLIVGLTGAPIYYLSLNPGAGLGSDELAQWGRVGQIVGAIAGLVAGVTAGLIAGPSVWLSNRFYDRLISRLSGGLVSGLVFGLGVGLSIGLSDVGNGLGWGLAAGLCVGIIVGLSNGLSDRLVFRLADALIVGLTAGLIVGLGNGLITWLVGVLLLKTLTSGLIGFWLFGGLSVGATVGLIVGLIGRLKEKTKPVEALQESGIEIRNWLVLRLRKGLILGLVAALILGLIVGLLIGSGEIQIVQSIALLTNRLGLGLLATPITLLISTTTGAVAGASSGGLLGALIGALSSGLTGPDIERRTAPNQGIRQSAVNIRKFTLIGGLTLGLMWGLINLSLAVMMTGIALRTGELLGFGLSNMLFLGLLSGLVPGAACIQHFTLRVILYWGGSIPWNYARFLDYATERMFLQRVGGRYRFVHALLREHFAQMNREQLPIH